MSSSTTTQPPAPPRYLSTAQAAAALRVGVSTIKRWVDEGVLPAHRTAGGHRKLLHSEVLALAREGKLGNVDLGPLLLDTRSKRRGPLKVAELTAELQRAITEGTAELIQAMLLRAYQAGMPLEALADQVIAPVMERLGHDWETRQIDVWQEHRGTQICTAALYELFGHIAPRTEQQRPLAVGAGPEGDPYHLALLLAQLALIDAGWRVVNLGPNTPFASLTHAVHHLRPRLVWISASHLPNPERFVREYAMFQQAASGQGAALAVGGAALGTEIRKRLNYTMHGDGLTQLVQFARTLHPRPRPPRRGRPSKHL